MKYGNAVAGIIMLDEQLQPPPPSKRLQDFKLEKRFERGITIAISNHECSVPCQLSL